MVARSSHVRPSRRRPRRGVRRLCLAPNAPFKTSRPFDEITVLGRNADNRGESCLAMSKSSVGRNDPCPCGSGRKFKKCHLNNPGATGSAIGGTSGADPQSGEFQAKAFALFDAKIASESRRRQKFGEVRPIMHTEAWGKRLVGVENRLYTLDPKASFSDFLRDYLRETLGGDWWKEEMAKPLAGRHQIAQWQAHAEQLMRGETPDERGRYLIAKDGLVTAYLTLAYDLFIVKDNIRFQANMIDRLRRRNDFVGVRYELLVAATFVRAGFQVEPDESDPTTKHPEFVATHRATKFVVAVEAKARNRRPTDRTPARAGVDDHIANAAQKAPKDKPFALFVDVAMPLEDREKPPSWAEEVDQAVRVVVEKHGGMPGPFDWVFFTNIPHQYGLTGEPDPPRQWVGWLPRKTRVPAEVQQAVVTAVQQYGRIPEFESA